MFEMRELYEEMVLDHNRNPRNFGRIDPHSHDAHGFNPICGDEFKIFLYLQDGVIQNVGYEGVGCSISTASTSLMTEAVKGKTEAQAMELFERMQKIFTGRDDGQPPVELGKLQVLQGVQDFPTRIKCAALSWHIMKAAIHGEQGTINTEGEQHVCPVDQPAHI